MQKYHKKVRELIKHEFTLYPSREVNGKVHRGRAPALVESNGENGPYIAKEYTGVTIHVIESHNGYNYAGVAVQMKDDQFNRKIGRNIAKGRAEQCLHYFTKGAFPSGMDGGWIQVKIGDSEIKCTILTNDRDRLVNHGLSNVPGV